jgi:hypothetical protein
MAVSIPTHIDYGSRNAVLRQLGLAAGLSATALDKSAGETHPNWMQQFNKILTALGMPTYTSLDMSAFGSVAGAIAAHINAIPLPPVVAAGQNFTLTLPVAANQIIGGVIASNSPTMFAIQPASNPGGWYAISASGQLTVTAAGATGIVAGNDILQVTATNAGGTSPAANVTVAVS